MMNIEPRKKVSDSIYTPLNCKPVVIVGAGRSGTNMLRDVLTKLETVSTWPCDEINYIWRHGNKAFITDEFEEQQATGPVIQYIRSQFRKFAASSKHSSFSSDEMVLVEKTCANSLRVGFVDKVLPEAKYVYLVRDGRDVVASATKRWTAPLDIEYLYAKARFVPKSDLLYYGFRYFLNRIKKFSNPDSRLSVWGPKFKGWHEIAKNQSLSSVCARQWIRCIEKSEKYFAKIDSSRVYKLRYEDFVQQPEMHLQEISEFLGLSVSPDELKQACHSVSTGSIGKAGVEKSSVPSGDLELMSKTLRLLGYRT